MLWFQIYGQDGSAAPPLVHLSDVIEKVSSAESFQIKEELLVATSSMMPAAGASVDM
jgi:hypothetical protein